jgi:TPR repeat protein
MRAKIILLSALALVANTCAASSAASPAREPSLSQIQAAFNAESSCELADPAGLLAEFPLAWLADVQSKALHSDAVELTKFSADGGIGLREYLATRRLRIRGQFDLADVYAVDCRLHASKAQIRALSQLKPADALVIADFAWVPLVGAGQEYLGSGLIFVLENKQWRYFGIDRSAFGNTPSTSSLLQDLRTQTAFDSEDPAAFVSACPMPKAPQTQLNFDLAKAYEHDVYADIYPDGDSDPKNTLGALQRAAVRRHAEGKQVAPSAVAQLLFAEVLIRSLEFDSAPKPESPQWLSRVTRAQQFFEQAHARGADLARFLPLIPWLAEVNLRGSGAHPIDTAKAQQLYKIAAEAGDADAVSIYARFKTSGFAATPVDCSGALELLKKNADSYAEGIFAFESALVIGQCADANFREKNYSLIPALLKKVDTKYFDADRRSEFQQLQAFVDCQSSSNPANCVPPPAKFQTSVTEAALSKAKLAGQNAIPNQAYPGRLRDAPAPEALSCE